MCATQRRPLSNRRPWASGSPRGLAAARPHPLPLPSTKKSAATVAKQPGQTCQWAAARRARAATAMATAPQVTCDYPRRRCAGPADGGSGGRSQIEFFLFFWKLSTAPKTPRRGRGAAPPQAASTHFVVAWRIWHAWSMSGRCLCGSVRDRSKRTSTASQLFLWAQWPRRTYARASGRSSGDLQKLRKSKRINPFPTGIGRPCGASPYQSHILT